MQGGSRRSYRLRAVASRITPTSLQGGSAAGCLVTRQPGPGEVVLAESAGTTLREALPFSHPAARSMASGSGCGRFAVVAAAYYELMPVADAHLCRGSAAMRTQYCSRNCRQAHVNKLVQPWRPMWAERIAPRI